MTHVQNTVKGATTALKRSGFDPKPGIFFAEGLPLGHVYLTVLLFSPVRPFNYCSVLIFHWPTIGEGKITAQQAWRRP